MMRPNTLADASGDTAFFRFAAQTLLVSGIVAAVGVVLLISMFVAFAVGATGPAQSFGRMNDVAILIAYLLCAPSVVAAYRLLAPSSPTSSALLLVLGLVSIAAIVILQALLVLEVLTFAEQVVPVSLALLALGAWFIVIGVRCARAGVLPHGGRIGLVAAAYIGYPVWAVQLARVLRAHGEGPAR